VSRRFAKWRGRESNPRHHDFQITQQPHERNDQERILAAGADRRQRPRAGSDRPPHIPLVDLEEHGDLRGRGRHSGRRDHVDAHRMPAFVISPWARRGAVVHTRYDQPRSRSTAPTWCPRRCSTGSCGTPSTGRPLALRLPARTHRRPSTSARRKHYAPSGAIATCGGCCRARRPRAAERVLARVLE